MKFLIGLCLFFLEGKGTNDQVGVTNWFQDELVLFSGSTGEIGAKTVCDVTKDIKKYKWVMREAGSGTAQIFKSKLGRYVTDLNVVMELGHSEAIKKAVKADAGIGCLSNLAVCRAISRGWLYQIPLKGVDMRRQLTIIQHKNKAKTRLMSEFLDFCFVLSQHGEGQACLSSPEKFQDLVLQFTEKSKNTSPT